MTVVRLTLLLLSLGTITTGLAVYEIHKRVEAIERYQRFRAEQHAEPRSPEA